LYVAPGHVFVVVALAVGLAVAAGTGVERLVTVGVAVGV
jgi:hypothetical protein